MCRDEALAAVAQARAEGEAAGRASVDSIKAVVLSGNAAKVEEATQRVVQYKEKTLQYFGTREEEVMRRVSWALNWASPSSALCVLLTCAAAGSETERGS